MEKSGQTETCEQCDESSGLFKYLGDDCWDSGSLRKEWDGWYIRKQVDSLTKTWQQIKYCPFCGRLLKSKKPGKKIEKPADSDDVSDKEYFAILKKALELFDSGKEKEGLVMLHYEAGFSVDDICGLVGNGLVSREDVLEALGLSSENR